MEGPCPSAAREKEVYPSSVHCEIYLRLPFSAFVSPVHVEINEIRLMLIYGAVMPSVCVALGMLSLAKTKDVQDFKKILLATAKFLVDSFSYINKINA